MLAGIDLDLEPHWLNCPSRAFKAIRERRRILGKLPDGFAQPGIEHSPNSLTDRSDWPGLHLHQVDVFGVPARIVEVQLVECRATSEGHGLAKRINRKQLDEGPREHEVLFNLGYVVSGSVSPTLSTNIGTGYVPVGVGQPGESCEIDLKGKRQPASFCALPFYSRTRK